MSNEFLASLTIRPMRPGDVERSRVVGQMAWSDMAYRDIGRRVRYPMRSRRIIEAYMAKEPQGCLVAQAGGNIVGAVYCHVWGRVGWIGPLEVLPDLQRRGIGSSLLARGEDHLRSRGCEVVGLETMPHILGNMRFYLSAGYRADKLTLLAEKGLRNVGDVGGQGVREVTDMPSIAPRLAELSRSVSPLLDYSTEFQTTVGMGLGSVLVREVGGRVAGAAALHTYPRTRDADYASIKVLLVDPLMEGAEETFHSLMDACECRAAELGKGRMYARYEADDNPLYRAMEGRGYVLKGTNVRLVKGGGRWRSRFHIASWAG